MILSNEWFVGLNGPYSLLNSNMVRGQVIDRVKWISSHCTAITTTAAILPNISMSMPLFFVDVFHLETLVNFGPISNLSQLFFLLNEARPCSLNVICTHVWLSLVSSRFSVRICLCTPNITHIQLVVYEVVFLWRRLFWQRSLLERVVDSSSYLLVL